MGFKKGKGLDDAPIDDPTAWMLTSPIAEFLLMHTKEIRYMCMFGYTFLHGHKLFSKMGNAAAAYKFVSFILACTGGGILVPIFINGIPVPIADDAYPIAIIASYVLHDRYPVLRQVLELSTVVKVFFVICYETLRASVVVKLTTAAALVIAPTTFSFPLFGPIMCGALGGCGGAFLPLNKGLEPMKKGLGLPMATAFFGAALFHLYVNTSLSDGCVDAHAKAHVHLAMFFVASGLIQALDLSVDMSATKTKKD
mmetsp:Transcript_3349/g.3752  ORF Transcript_3349/g.3752 Transcript_3349/m.3752 type:complete len:254 (+) Transcript_3349:75-836(+)